MESYPHCSSLLFKFSNAINVSILNNISKDFAILWVLSRVRRNAMKFMNQNQGVVDWK